MIPWLLLGAFFFGLTLGASIGDDVIEYKGRLYVAAPLTGWFYLLLGGMVFLALVAPEVALFVASPFSRLYEPTTKTIHIALRNGTLSYTEVEKPPMLSGAADLNAMRAFALAIFLAAWLSLYTGYSIGYSLTLKAKGVPEPLTTLVMGMLNIVKTLREKHYTIPVEEREPLVVGRAVLEVEQIRSIRDALVPDEYKALRRKGRIRVTLHG